MRDYNFFEPYLHHAKSRNKGRTFTYLLFFLVLALIGLLYWFNLQEINQINDEINTIQDDINALGQEDYLGQMKVLEEKGLSLEARLKAVSSFKAYLDQTYVVTDELIEELVVLIPRDMFLSSWSISDSSISMQGFAYDRSIVAEYEYALRDSGNYQNIHVSIIAESGLDLETVYNFTLTFTLKEVQE